MRQVFKTYTVLRQIKTAAVDRADCEINPMTTNTNKSPSLVTSCYWNIRCCATKYLQMAAGDKFSRIRSYAGILFLSAVNTSMSSPLRPTPSPHLDHNLHCPLQQSHCFTAQPVKPHKGRKHGFLQSRWKKWVLWLRLFHKEFSFSL